MNASEPDTSSTQFFEKNFFQKVGMHKAKDRIIRTRPTRESVLKVLQLALYENTLLHKFFNNFACGSNYETKPKTTKF